MKILQVVASLDPRGGGVSEGVKKTSQALMDFGHHVEVVTLDEPDADYLRDSMLAVHPQGRLIKRYGYTSRLAPWVKKNHHRFDVVILNSLWNFASIGAWQGLRGSGVPYFIYSHGMMDPWFKKSHPLKHLAKTFYWLAFQGRVLRDAKAVLFTAEEERLRARNVFPGFPYNESVVGYGTNLPPQGADVQKASFISAFPELRNKRFLLFLGRVHPIKGCDILLDAFLRSLSDEHELDLVIAGPDQVGLRAALEKRVISAGVRHRVHWTGMISGDIKWGALRLAEAFLLPSHHENFGIAVAESLACGTPVLISEHVATWRQVEAAGAGVVFQNSTDQVSNAICHYVRMSAEQKQTMSEAALAVFGQHFEISVATKRLTSILEDAVRERH